MPIDPDKILAEAKQEPVKPKVTDYAEAMIELRSKGFTLRQIADWLGERGIDVDHNAVYRTLTTAPVATPKAARSKSRGPAPQRAGIDTPQSGQTPDDESPIPL